MKEKNDHELGIFKNGSLITKLINLTKKQAAALAFRISSSSKNPNTGKKTTGVKIVNRSKNKNIGRK